ncbi:MAG: NAD(P)/FAD-dependent oxidoreductase [Lachnospiraceae bacterium]|nr:NAD(P)/FAD-dependent oxidoreductase [Lachnospiraceae bacterium]
MYDVIIIGAGVTGCCIARELSKTKRKVLVLEAALDVCEGTSKANSGIVHAGFDAVPGSLKAKLNVRGNQMMDELARELDIPFRRNGSLVLCLEEAGRDRLKELYQRGMENGVSDLQILSADEAKALEPQLSESVVAALYAPTGGIVCPFELTIAMAENAAVNGVEFERNREVVELSQIESGYRVITKQGNVYETAVIINAAGVYADMIHNMLPCKEGHEPMRLIARRGEYCLYDKKAGLLTDKTIFQLPGAYGKGILVTPTIHGNQLLGPTAMDIEDKEGVNTTAEGLEQILEKAANSVKSLPPKGQVITSFAGLRAHHESDDFIIKESEVYKGFIDVAGIESPGLTSAPAIGEYVAELLMRIQPARRRDDFVGCREGIKALEKADTEERNRLIKENPAYANVICRCETVSEAEIIEAIRRPVGAVTLDGVKRRTRASMGRCQGGFCTPKIMKLLSDELGVPMEEICKTGEGSTVILGDTK